jgi:hypothetical protein
LTALPLIFLFDWSLKPGTFPALFPSKFPRLAGAFVGAFESQGGVGAVAGAAGLLSLFNAPKLITVLGLIGVVPRLTIKCK